MNISELEKVIHERRSVRVWKDQPVPEELLLKAVEMATWAPNAGNQQNWKFYIIVNRDVITQIADAVQSSADMLASWPEAARFGDKAIAFFKRSSFFRTAPAAIAVAASQYQSTAELIIIDREKTDPVAKEMREWRRVANSRIQSVSAAIAYLLLVLPQMGLGSVWMTGPMQAKGAIEKILKVPAGLDIVAFLPVGYPAENPSLKERKPADQVVEVIR